MFSGAHGYSQISAQDHKLLTLTFGLLYVMCALQPIEIYLHHSSVGILPPNKNLDITLGRIRY